MAIFYIDPANGSDSNGGTSWADAWKTILNGATAARIAPGDIIRIAKSPDPTSIGAALWTGAAYLKGDIPGGTQNIASSTNATPIVVTKAGHGLSNGSVVVVWNHSTNTAANGQWLVGNVTANTFELVGSVGNGTGGATGYLQNVTSRCVVLETPVNQTITQATTSWTAGTNVTSAAASATYYKRYGMSVKIVTAAGHAGTGILAYQGLPAPLNLSGYEQVSFWIRTDFIVANAGDLKLRLYSDTSCTVQVESFDLPAIPFLTSYSSWTVLTLNKGSALSATVQGVALYANIAMASKTFYINNIIACKSAASADSLSLTSLISKNSNAQGGDEPWYGIQSIDGRIIVLDAATASQPYSARGYSGATETVITYKRETFKTPMASSASTNVNAVNDSGTDGNNIQFQGGYDTSSNLQNGETFYDGSNGLGRGLYIAKSYITTAHLSFVRYRTGVYLDGTTSTGSTFGFFNLNNNILQGAYFTDGDYNTVTVISCCCNGSEGIVFTGAALGYVATLGKCSSNLLKGVYLSGSGNTLSIAEANCNDEHGIFSASSVCGNVWAIGSTSYNSLSGFYLSVDCCNNDILSYTESSYNDCGINFQDGASFNTVKRVGTFVGNSAAAINFGRVYDNMLSGGTTTGNIGVLAGPGRNYLYDWALNNSTKISSFTSYAGGIVYMGRRGGDDNDHCQYHETGTITYQTSTKEGDSLGAWKISPTSSMRGAAYPLKLKVATIVFAANAEVTVTIRAMRDDAAIGLKLVCPGGQIYGVPDDVASDSIVANANEWQTLSMSFTPLSKGGADIYVYGWTNGGVTYSGYVCNLTVTQA